MPYLPIRSSCALLNPFAAVTAKLEPLMSLEAALQELERSAVSANAEPISGKAGSVVTMGRTGEQK